MIEHYLLKNNIEYWKVTNVDSILNFDEFRQKLKKIKFNNKNKFNPFHNQNISNITETNNVLKFLESFYHNQIDKTLPTKNGFDSWTNYYLKNNFKCTESGLIPHIDCVSLYDGIVANLWLNEELCGSGTNLYHYNGKLLKTSSGYKMDFMVDPSHKLFSKYHSLDNKEKLEYINSDWKSWGFEYVGIAPSEYKTMTIYKINTPHTAFIPSDIKVRWSASFLYEAFCPIILS